MGLFTQTKRLREIERDLTSNALVPLSIKSNFVNTPNVLSPVQFTNRIHKGRLNKATSQEFCKKCINIPEGSTSLASLIASDVAIS